MSFANAIQNSVANLLKRFSLIYPNLVPVLHAIYQHRDATVGTRLAIQYATQALYEVKTKTLSTDNRHKFKLDNGYFQRGADNTQSCAAPIFAQSILRHAGISALETIAKYPENQIRECDPKDCEINFSLLLSDLIKKNDRASN